jgi:hypothetical protein
LVTASEALVVGAAIVGAFQLYASIRLLASTRYTGGQKVWQLLLVWLVPFFGALAIHLFMESDSTPASLRDTSFTAAPGGNPEGIGPGNEHA